MAFEITRLIVDSVTLFDAIHTLEEREKKVGQVSARLNVDFFHGKLINGERLIDNRYLEAAALFHLRLDVYASDQNLWQPRLEQVSTYGRDTRRTFCALSRHTYSGPFYHTKHSLAKPASILEYAKFCLQTQHFLTQPEPREQASQDIRKSLGRSLRQAI